MNMHLPIDSPRQGVKVCLHDNVPWPCENVDAYWLPKDGCADFETTLSCALINAAGHFWGPWVLSPVYANREDRFCMVCGEMEMQTIE